MVFDRNGNDFVMFDEFEKFWKEYIYVYSEITHETSKFNKHSHDLMVSTFEYIANIRAEIGEKRK